MPELPPAMVTCPDCGEDFQGAWADDSMDVEQMDAPPVADQECPACGQVVKDMPYPGWTFMGEAG